MRTPPHCILYRAAAIACALSLLLCESLAALETIPLMFA
jgi:hypothetical protein